MHKLFLILICFFSSLPFSANAQNNRNLFDADSVLHITLSGNIRDIINDRSDNPKNHPLIISYQDETGKDFSVPVQARTRGHFRRTLGSCTYPPILLQLAKSDSLSSSLFWNQHKLKLVMPCRGDQYVVREWMAYKIYNLITSESFRVRLVSIALNDTKRNKTTPPFYGLLLEEAQQMAKRNHEILINKQTNPEEINSDAFLKMALFEYLIGNTDWSVQYQNIKIIAQDLNAVPVAVPYDFDFSGLVNAPYSAPAEGLELSSVRERRYRGYCMPDVHLFNDVISFYNNLKPAIYKLYENCALLDQKYIKETLAYFDSFYKTINDPIAAKKEFTYPCNKNGTGNVVIKGLKGGSKPEEDSDQ